MEGCLGWTEACSRQAGEEGCEQAGSVCIGSRPARRCSASRRSSCSRSGSAAGTVLGPRRAACGWIARPSRSCRPGRRTFRQAGGGEHAPRLGRFQGTRGRGVRLPSPLSPPCLISPAWWVITLALPLVPLQRRLEQLSGSALAVVHMKASLHHLKEDAVQGLR